MRICLINLGALPTLSEKYKHHRTGGEETQQGLLAQRLASMRGPDGKVLHTVHLITGDYGQANVEDVGGILVHRLRSEGRLWKRLRDVRCEVFYFSCASRLLAILALFCKVHGKRLVFRVARDDDVDERRGGLRRPWDRWLYAWGLRRCDAILVQTEMQQLALWAHYRLWGEVAGMFVERGGQWDRRSVIEQALDFQREHGMSPDEYEAYWRDWELRTYQADGVTPK